ncbi:JDVT-CTERM system glutamic-type intramembrane protease [Thiomicrorhabdus sp.]|uniref:JDVT-CTERM system glutamic-type intramembrane protease MrtJ n=1 Tax=Thiomicrorhabdus sp. TaxID=2039724 RepID=UPI0029C957D5|nr:JDVT-CTERM system glutamic-type intramembrane protease [Thiomicrorhabdus sp.]
MANTDTNLISAWIGQNSNCFKDRLFVAAMGGGLVVAAIYWLCIYSGMPQEWRPALIASILVFPVLEELAFRGWLQTRLKTRFAQEYYGFSLANLLTSLLFSGMHLGLHSPAWSLAVLVPSLIFGFFRDRFGGVAPAIVLHVFYNGCFFVLLTFPAPHC